MKKSTHTPDAATPGQVLEQDSGRAAKTPAGPVRIYTDLDRKFFLGYHDANDCYIKIVSAGSTFFQTWLIETYGQSSCRIKCAQSGLYIDGQTKLPLLPFVRARPERDGSWQGWTFTEVGDGRLYFTNNYSDKVLTVAGTPSEGIGLTVLARTSNTPNELQKFFVYF